MKFNIFMYPKPYMEDGDAIKYMNELAERGWETISILPKHISSTDKHSNGYDMYKFVCKEIYC